MKKNDCFKGVLALLVITAMLLPMWVISTSAAEYDAAGATRLVFSDDGIKAEDGKYTDYKIEGTALSIKGEGVYILSGSCSDGSVTVKKGVKNVTLVLDGLTLSCAESAPLTCNKSSSATIVVASGSVNTLSDTVRNNDDVYPDNQNAENAVIKCKDGSQVTICGGGTLTVDSKGKNGIKSGATTDEEGEAFLVIKELTLNITTTVNDAVNAEATLSVPSGNIKISAADDALHSDMVLNIGEAGTAGPTIVIDKCYEGLEGATVNVYSGNITIHAEDDCINAANSDLSNYSFAINISGGDLYMDTTTGDGIDSNGTLTISGGSVVVWTANTADNQPLDADGKISITGGTVLAAGGSAGMGLSLNATQPTIVIGSSGGMGGGRPGGMQGFGGDRNNKNDKNNGKDGGGFTDQSSDRTTPPGGFGGFGGSGAMGGASSLVISAGDTVSFKAADGSTVYSFTATYNTAHIVFSSPALTSGAGYTLTVGGNDIATVTAETGSVSGSSIDNIMPDGDPIDPNAPGLPGGDDMGETTNENGEVVQKDPAEPQAKGTTVLLIAVIAIAALLVGAGVSAAVIICVILVKRNKDK